MKTFRCIYNHELLIALTSVTPYQTYDQPVRKEQFIGLVSELSGRGVDLIMCCPTAWRLPLYHSTVNTAWKRLQHHHDPAPGADWKYFDYIINRAKSYMLKKNAPDPLKLSLATAHDNNMAAFVSFRMNDIHAAYFGNERIPPTMDPMWVDHPEFRLPSGSLDYSRDEVREYYFRLIEELVLNYDIDGVELDFMRSPIYFASGKVKEGTKLMTDLVRRISELISSCKKPLQLAVRVPRTVEMALNCGLDVACWKRDGLINMITVSSFFITSPEIAVEDYIRLPGKNCSVNGELHYIRHKGNGKMLGNVNRRTTALIYRTMAAALRERGVTGVSFFNFAYTRHHHFNEARRRCYMDSEPPFEALQPMNSDFNSNWHYIVGPGFGMLPQPVPGPAFNIRIFLPGRPEFAAKAIFRLEIDRPGFIWSAIKVRLKDEELQQQTGCGELFAPLTNEALPNPEQLFFFKIPPRLLHNGWNVFTVDVPRCGEYISLACEKFQVVGVEFGAWQYEM